MSQKNFLYWLFQILGWGFIIFIGILNDFQNSEISTSKTITNGLIIMLIGVGITHLYRAYILSHQWLNLKIIQVLPRIVLGSIVTGFFLLILTQLISFIIDDVVIEKVIVPIKVIENLIGQFITIFIWSILYFAFHFFERSRSQEISNLQLEAAKQKAELSSLKSQMNPHFMFNSLNNIRALIDENPLIAKKSINELSNLLRASLNTKKLNLILFKDELELVEDYLSLEKIRFENRLTIKFNISKESLSYLVPPMLVQTLVENGIKHGISKLKNGGEINISSSIKNDALIILIKNDGEFNPSIDKTNGTGLKNSRKRIELLYSSKSSLVIKNKNTKVHTEIKLHHLKS
jgi:LytS/YehU family sensor histidine kinase